MTKTIAAVVLMPVALSSIVCHKNSSSAPTGPSSAPTGSVISIVIQGPSRIAPGETVQFTAFATFGDRTTRRTEGNPTQACLAAKPASIQCHGQRHVDQSQSGRFGNCDVNATGYLLKTRLQSANVVQRNCAIDWRGAR